MFDLALFGNDILRVCVGAFLLPHGLPKLFNFKSEAKKLKAELGLRPGLLWTAIMVFVQVPSALMIIANIAVIPNLVLVVVLHLAAIILKNKNGGWYWHKKGIEYNAFWICSAIACGFQVYGTQGFSFL